LSIQDLKGLRPGLAQLENMRNRRGKNIYCWERVSSALSAQREQSARWGPQHSKRKN
jgi:hypothetical protein